MNSPASPRAIVVGHGDFATGMVSAVDQIIGQADVLLPLTTLNLAGSGIEQMVRERLESTGVKVIFTDLPGGSATMAVRRVQRDHKDLTVVSGVNLPMLLEFVQNANGVVRDAALAAMERGKSSMISL